MPARWKAVVPSDDVSSGTSSIELISSHLPRLQIDFDNHQAAFRQLQESHRDLLDRVHTLEREPVTQPASAGSNIGLSSCAISLAAWPRASLAGEMSAEALYPGDVPEAAWRIEAQASSNGSWGHVTSSGGGNAIPASPISPEHPVQSPVGGFLEEQDEDLLEEPLTEEVLGGLMSQDTLHNMPRDGPPAVQEQLPLEGFISFAACPGDWHAMNSSLILARHSRQCMPWERTVKPRLGASQVFQEPLLGRFDGLRRVALPTHSTAPWAWVPKGTFEARRLLAARFAKSDDMLRLAALKKIRLLVLFFPDDSELGRNLVSSAGSLVEETVLTSTIEDAFSGRAARTLRKRASDFSRFAKWRIKAAPGSY